MMKTIREHLKSCHFRLTEKNYHCVLAAMNDLFPTWYDVDKAAACLYIVSRFADSLITFIDFIELKKISKKQFKEMMKFAMRYQKLAAFR